jgi:hypothetical protein
MKVEIIVSKFILPAPPKEGRHVDINVENVAAGSKC